MGRRRRHKRTHGHRRGRGFVTTLALFALLVGAIVWLDGSNRQNFTGAAIAVDGDSLQMGGKRLRLSGIDAPELAQTCDVAGQVWLCGRQARASLRRLLAKDLSCTTTGLDRYERHLVRCTAGGKDIGAAMVAAGMAVSYGAYGAQEAAARAAKRGLWRGNFTRPQAWREANNQRDEQTGAVLRNGFDRLRHWGQTVLNRFMKGEG